MLIGLTGSIASGKSTVSDFIKHLGIPVIDADVVAREVVEPGSETLETIEQYFGKRVISPDGTLNRKELGTIIFNNESERTKLNAIIHPAIRNRMQELKETYIAAGKSVIVYDIPLLFESKLQQMVDKILLVYVDQETQLSRLMERDRSTEEDALSRILSQIPLEEKKKLADEIIDNNGNKDDTYKQLISILNKWNIIKA